MAARGGAPWVEKRDGKLHVRFRDERGSLPDREPSSQPSLWLRLPRTSSDSSAALARRLQLEPTRMAEIPRAVLSEHFQERMSGRRLRSAVFLTYQFDPGFFEQEVLPVFLDVSLSHATAIRVVQLEDALRSLPGEIAVYYDANGLNSGDGGSAKLDVRRIPIRHHTGIFHPKNVFLLVENEEPDDDGHHPQTLLIASLSANLTRSGWWENVEACHVEEIAEGDKTRLKDDVSAFLESTAQQGGGGGAARARCAKSSPSFVRSNPAYRNPPMATCTRTFSRAASRCRTSSTTSAGRAPQRRVPGGDLPLLR